MRSRPVFALFAVVLLAVLVGCKKRNKVGDEIVELPPPPATYPDTPGGKVAKALDESAAKMAKLEPDKLFEVLKTLPMESPKDGRVSGIDASAERELIDAAFARWWREAQRLPDRTWESLCHQNGLANVERKRGTYEEGRARGERTFQKPYSAQLTKAGDAEVPGEYAEVNVTGGTDAKWTTNLNLSVSGHVEFRGVLELRPFTGGAVAKLDGSVGEVRLFGNSVAPYGDFVGLKANAVVLGTKLPAVFRVGPGVASVRYDGVGVVFERYKGLLLIRGAKGVAIAPPANDSKIMPDLVVIRY